MRPGGIFYNCDASLMQIGYKPVVSWRKTGRERQKWGKPSEFSRCAWPFSCCSRAAGRSAVSERAAGPGTETVSASAAPEARYVYEEVELPEDVFISTAAELADAACAS